ncbi:MAG TPA: nucleotidyltransferase family protein [Rhodospirillales bacterium]|jgi:MurNAc alpha-1-phosphate uridylyltransferase|nr:MAG: D-glycero-alpha-D-manno-heptose 1-phosphate guanylyltransferase [Alphaproteobacteria bacterium MarineAlpha3_Bin2]HIC28255.1 nucleotidyltransferase family protein [Rhodospirillales bacterium]HIM24633.1 nucleotidyltransferase family protein [Rhodospirillales bacterium]
MIPYKAMVLAAGLGTRLKPVTDTLPKALVQVDNRALIDHALDRLEAVGVGEVVVNTHYLAEQLQAHLSGRKSPVLQISHEDDLLDTGGGIAKALPLLGDDPFLAVNADAFWLNGPYDALQRMAHTWDDDTMDGLLLLHSTVEAYGYTGLGDFCAPLGDGVLTRRLEGEVSPWLFTGIQMLHPRLFKTAPDGAFSLNLLYDRAIESGRLLGVVHDGEWFHVGTPQGLEEAETYMHLRYAGKERR